MFVQFNIFGPIILDTIMLTSTLSAFLDCGFFVPCQNSIDSINYPVYVTFFYNNDYDNSSLLGVGKDLEYYESHEGRLIDAKGVEGRYVRLYSRGSTYSSMYRYTEVEVWCLKK